MPPTRWRRRPRSAARCPAPETRGSDRRAQVLGLVEALAQDLWPDALSAVAAEPDPRKGERLVLLTEKRGATRAEFLAYAKQRGAADLMVPADVLVVESLPLLGSGKVDFVGVGRLLRERNAATAAA